MWFQDVQSSFPSCEGVKVTSCLALAEAAKRGRSDHRHATLRVGDFEVARSGGVWVANGGCIWPRVGARGGARACSPRCVRMRSITTDSRMAAMILSSPPQLGQCSRSISKTRLSSRAHPMRAGRRCGLVGSAAPSSDAQASSSGHAGTTSARSLALGASTPWAGRRAAAPAGRACCRSAQADALARGAADSSAYRRRIR